MKFVKLQCLVIDKSHELLFLEYRSLIYHRFKGNLFIIAPYSWSEHFLLSDQKELYPQSFHLRQDPTDSQKFVNNRTMSIVNMNLLGGRPKKS